MQRKTHYGEERLDALQVICQVPIKSLPRESRSSDSARLDFIKVTTKQAQVQENGHQATWQQLNYRNYRQQLTGKAKFIKKIN